MKREEAAKENFLRGLNCCQSVFCAFDDVTGLDEKTAMKLSAPLGGGVGRMREVCGAVSAMMMVLGAAFYDADHPTLEEKTALYSLEQELAGRFRSRHGTIVCRELLAGILSDDSPQAEARTEEYYKKRPCLGLCGEAAALLEEFLREKGKLPRGEEDKA